MEYILEHDIDLEPAEGFVFYRLSNPKILQACRLMREVLIEQFERAGALSRLHAGQSDHDPEAESAL